MIPFASQRKDAEEVLTSIRKMVSEEARAKSDEATAGPLTLGIEDLADTSPLMLTPEHVVPAEVVEADTSRDGDSPSDSDAPSDSDEPSADPVAEHVLALRNEVEDKVEIAPALEPEIKQPEPVAVKAPQPSAVPLSASADNILVDEIEGDVPQIDEVVLRQMVRDVVREELEGELGERMTRNIRKLVRKEIKQAFNIED